MRSKGATYGYQNKKLHINSDNTADSVQNLKKQLKHSYFERSLFDYMEHKHLSTDYSLKRF